LEQGKFVTHEWYAGGHPPLPSFEVASFARQMPVHWKPLNEKQDFKYRHGMLRREDRMVANAIRYYTQDPRGPKFPIEAIKSNYLEANFGSPDSELEHDLAQPRDAIVGGAAVLKMYARLIRDFTKQSAENQPAGGDYHSTRLRSAWPELALYDCTACHHELRSGLGLNDRPERNHKPGRPPLAAWPMVLTRLAAQQAAGFKEADATTKWTSIENLVRELEAAVTKQPFGERAGMEKQAERLAAELDKLALDAMKTRFTKEAAVSAVKFLAEPRNYETRDFYAARQAAWALRECFGAGPSYSASDVLQGASGPLALELPSGPNRSVMQNLNVWLPAAAEYDPAWFKKELMSVQAKLPQ
jgi:hypothetical protein